MLTHKGVENKKENQNHKWFLLVVFQQNFIIKID